MPLTKEQVTAFRDDFITRFSLSPHTLALGDTTGKVNRDLHDLQFDFYNSKALTSPAYPYPGSQFKKAVLDFMDKGVQFLRDHGDLSSDGRSALTVYLNQVFDYVAASECARSLADQDFADRSFADQVGAKKKALNEPVPVAEDRDRDPASAGNTPEMVHADDYINPIASSFPTLGQEIGPQDTPSEAGRKRMNNRLVNVMTSPFYRVKEGNVPADELRTDLQLVLNGITTAFSEEKEGEEKIPYEVRLDAMLQNLVPMYDRLAEIHKEKYKDLSNDAYMAIGDDIVTKKIEADAVLAQVEKQVEKLKPDSPLLQQCREDPFHSFRTPGTDEANRLKKTYEEMKFGMAKPYDVFEASWNYLGKKNSTPYSTFGKERVSAAVKVMAEATISLIKSVNYDRIESDFMHEAQLECMRSHEFRMAILDGLCSKPDSVTWDRNTITLFSVAFTAEQTCPGKNGPATGKMPPEGTDSANRTLEKMKTALQNKFGDNYMDWNKDTFKKNLGQEMSRAQALLQAAPRSRVSSVPGQKDLSSPQIGGMGLK